MSSDGTTTVGEAARAKYPPQRVITPRIPKTMHDELKAEAHRQQTSLNQLCVEYLAAGLAASRDAAADASLA